MQETEGNLGIHHQVQRDATQELKAMPGRHIWQTAHIKNIMLSKIEKNVSHQTALSSFIDTNISENIS